MATPTIQSHNFDVAKKQIKDLSKKVPEKVNLNPVGSTGVRNLATADGVNQLIKDIQSLFIKYNSNIDNLYKEFEKVYNAFDYLDNDYIKAILHNLDLANTAREEINETIETLMASVEAFTLFKEKTESKISSVRSSISEHYSNFQNYKKGNEQVIKDIIQKIENSSTKYANLRQEVLSLNASYKDSVDLLSSEVKILNDFKDKAEALKHLSEIDIIWESVEDHAEKINLLQTQINELKEKVNNELSNKNFENLQKIFQRKQIIAYTIAGSAILTSVGHIVLSFFNVL